MRSGLQYFQLLLLILAATFVACDEKSRVYGTLTVRSLASGTYEIYKVNNDKSRQFFAETTGRYNEPIQLMPGSYLLMSDCSSHSVLIKPQNQVTVISHRISFTSTKPTTDKSKFVIECRRTQDLRFRQKFSGTFELDVLAGNVDLLVGMQPMHFELGESDYAEPVNRTIPLSSVVIRSQRATSNTSEYFVSKSHERIALTQSQEFGERIFLLPGSYRVELNGTAKTLDLGENEHFELEVGYFSVRSSDSVDIDSSLEVRGRPLSVIVNSAHEANLNEQYPVLPGILKIRLVGSDREHTLEVLAGETEDLPVRSVTLDSSCSAWYWECLGRRKVYLYETGKTYAFAEGVTDVPLLYVGDEVWIGIEGSYDVRYRLSDNQRDLNLNLGYVRVEPVPQLSKNSLTDLVRLESINERYAGQTLDVDLLQTSTYPLIPGYYAAASYSSTVGQPNSRRSVKKGFVVRKGDTSLIKVPVYLTQRRYRRFLQQKKKLEHQQQQALERKWTASYRPGRRLHFK